MPSRSLRIPKRFRPIVVVIPARGGSKRIKRKALAPLRNGAFLLSRTLDQALGLKKRGWIDHVVVSTENPEIQAMAAGVGGQAIHLIDRPARLATDRASSLDVIRHAVDVLGSNGIHASTVVLLQVTSPLRRDCDIRDCLERFAKGDVDSVVTVSGTHPPPEWMFWKRGNVLGNPVVHGCKRAASVALNGAVYISSANRLAFHGFTQGRCAFVEMPWGLSIDVDQPADLALAEKIEHDDELRKKLTDSAR